MDINTAAVAHEVVSNEWGMNVRVNILSGHDEAHAVIIDRPSAALALIAAAQAYLENVE